eukprot:CAMPEP_0202355168 /NCGR_PEP_ID=MMETSP1126-20121109/10176_1 /ASSEMBLY_ACC=CAM_ASM_000457 /TAXON_ID=3047 /ORGANISM="Dunaliella tertiolecta, Strain CCMP1320" /LENGTH=41 /DNA_ID= /DNA_START= /DNA_END= /DNA_ORIENTATION=
MTSMDVSVPVKKVNWQSASGPQVIFAYSSAHLPQRIWGVAP